MTERRLSSAHLLPIPHCFFTRGERLFVSQV